MVALAEQATEPGVGPVGERGGLPCARLVRGALALLTCGGCRGGRFLGVRGEPAQVAGEVRTIGHGIPFAWRATPRPRLDPQFGRCNAPRP